MTPGQASLAMAFQVGLAVGLIVSVCISVLQMPWCEFGDGRHARREQTFCQGPAFRKAKREK